MSRGPWLHLLVVILATTLACVWSARSARHAQAALQSASARHVQVVRDAQELMRLRTQQETVSLHARPAHDVISQVNDTLTAAGLPAKLFRSLTPGGTTTIGSRDSGRTVRRQAVRLELAHVRPLELGQFLTSWNARQSMWTPTHIELTHARADKPADTNRYNVTLVLSALYLD